MMILWNMEEEFLVGYIFTGGMVLPGLEYPYRKSLWFDISWVCVHVLPHTSPWILS